MRRRTSFIFGLLATSAVAGAWWNAAGAVERTSGPLAWDAYVWQRVWTSDVEGAVHEAMDATCARVVVLATEVDWPPPGTRPRRIDVAVEARGESLTAPIGLAMRIGPCRDGLATPAVREWLASIAVDRLAVWRASGFTVDEFQLDFDAGVSQLPAYTGCVEVIRAAVDVPVVITALPSWMRDGAFGDLIAAADGYVLQVHSIARPEGTGAIPPLCDPERARAWVERAARFGRPFRVALPTYAITFGFAPDGRYLGAFAESERAEWPAGARALRLESDPAVGAALVRGWARDRPAHLTGVSWYRLPVPGDRQNWSWATLRAAAHGRTPAPRLQVDVRASGPGRFDIDIVNAGNADATLDGIAVAVSGAATSGADALAGFALTPGEADALRFSAPDVFVERLRAGDRRTIGWVRAAARPQGMLQHAAP